MSERYEVPAEADEDVVPVDRWCPSCRLYVPIEKWDHHEC